MRRTRATQETTPPEIQKPDEQWRQELTRQQYDVLRRSHTEPAFTGRYLYAKDDGSYCCAGCGNELFRSDAKFASGTGWPSFVQPASEAAVELRTDKGWLLRRTEVVCRQCGGHLGHVFRDGPAPTHRRYCINSCALSFEPSPPDLSESDGQPATGLSHRPGPRSAPGSGTVSWRAGRRGQPAARTR